MVVHHTRLLSEVVVHQKLILMLLLEVVAELHQLLHQAQQLQYARLVVELAVITPVDQHRHVDQEPLEDQVVAKEQLLLESLDHL